MQAVTEELKSKIPASKIPLTGDAWHRVKFGFWRLYSPFNPFFRDLLSQVGLLNHVGRQEYLLGWLREGADIKKFLTDIGNKGFGNHFFAWRDDGEVLSLRILDGWEYQYHLRLFDDGELRGHYEYTPEAHPRMHIQEVVFEPRREAFLKWLGDWILPAEPAANFTTLRPHTSRSRSSS